MSKKVKTKLTLGIEPTTFGLLALLSQQLGQVFSISFQFFANVNLHTGHLGIVEKTIIVGHFILKQMHQEF